MEPKLSTLTHHVSVTVAATTFTSAINDKLTYQPIDQHVCMLTSLHSHWQQGQFPSPLNYCIYIYTPFRMYYYSRQHQQNNNINNKKNDTDNNNNSNNNINNIQQYYHTLLYPSGISTPSPSYIDRPRKNTLLLIPVIQHRHKHTILLIPIWNSNRWPTAPNHIIPYHVFLMSVMKHHHKHTVLFIHVWNTLY